MPATKTKSKTQRKPSASAVRVTSAAPSKAKSATKSAKRPASKASASTAESAKSSKAKSSAKTSTKPASKATTESKATTKGATAKGSAITKSATTAKTSGSPKSNGVAKTTAVAKTTTSAKTTSSKPTKAAASATKPQAPELYSFTTPAAAAKSLVTQKVTSAALPALFVKTLASSAKDADMLVQGALAASGKGKFEHGWSLARYSVSAKPAERRAIASGLRSAKAGLLFVHEAALQEGTQRARMIADWFESGGDLDTVMDWLRMASAEEGARSKRAFGLGGIVDAIGDGIGAIGGAIAGAISGIVDALVKAGKSFVSVVGKTLTWTVGEIANLCKKLFEKGRKIAEILSGALSQGFGLLRKYVQAVLKAGQSVANVLVWAATQVSGTIVTVLRELMAAGSSIAKIVADAASKGVAVITASVRALVAMAKPLRDILGGVATLASSVGKLVVSAVLAAGKLVKDVVTSALSVSAALAQKVMSALLSLGRTTLEIVQSVALQTATVVKGVMQALIAAGQKLGTIVGTIAQVAIQTAKNLVNGAIALGFNVAQILAGVAQHALASLKKVVNALIAAGRKVGEVLAAAANLAVSVTRTVLEALIASGVTFAKIVGGIVTDVAAQFRKGFFEGLIALGKAPLEILRAAAEIGFALTALAFAVLLEVLGGHRGLSPVERAAAVKVFGSSIDLDRVKIASASLASDFVNYVNGERPFTTMYVINFSSSDAQRTDAEFIATLIHELTHVWQGIQAGPLYMVQALEAQLRSGSEAYEYAEQDLIAAGGNFSKFNREQQASIIEDYWTRRFASTPAQDVTNWQPYADQVFRPVQGGGGGGGTTKPPVTGGIKDVPKDKGELSGGGPKTEPPKGGTKPDPFGPKGPKTPKGKPPVDPDLAPPKPGKPGFLDVDLVKAPIGKGLKKSRKRTPAMSGVSDPDKS